jgi:hypothetical protein
MGFLVTAKSVCSDACAYTAIKERGIKAFGAD